MINCHSEPINHFNVNCPDRTYSRVRGDKPFQCIYVVCVEVLDFPKPRHSEIDFIPFGMPAPYLSKSESPFPKIRVWIRV